MEDEPRLLGHERMGKDHPTWGGGHQWRTVIVASPYMVLRTRE
jgi:hypothetical protein